MNIKRSLYLILLLINLINITSVKACSDMVVLEKLGTIDFRYTSYCGNSPADKKFHYLSTFLKSLQNETDTDILILINRIPIHTTENPFISLAFDTLIEFDETLTKDFNSFYSYQKLRTNSELNNKNVQYFKNISYPMNISISKKDSIKKTGLKLIYNYKWDDRNSSEKNQLHFNRISKVLKWAINNISIIKETQQELIVKYDYYDWDLSVMSIPK